MPLLCCDVGLVSELRLTAGCVLMDLASPAVSGTSVYANGFNIKYLSLLTEEQPVLMAARDDSKKLSCNSSASN